MAAKPTPGAFQQKSTLLWGVSLIGGGGHSLFILSPFLISLCDIGRFRVHHCHSVPIPTGVCDGSADRGHQATRPQPVTEERLALGAARFVASLL